MQRIVLLGDSVVLSCIGGSLSREGWEVGRLEPGEPDPAAQLHCLSPRAVLFEIGRAPADSILDLLLSEPGLLVIALDPLKHRMSVLSCQEERAETTIDLVQALSGSGSELSSDTADQPTVHGGTS